MRIASLLPSATEMVCALGLKNSLVGITHECDFPAGIEHEIPVLIESCLGPEGKNLPPDEIDRRIREALAAGQGVYRFKPGTLEAAKPDLIITQGLCDVCAVPNNFVVQAAKHLRPSPEVISLDPTDVTGVLADIRKVGEAAGAVEAAGTLVEELEERIGAVAGKCSAIPEAKRPRVACIEWFEPIFFGGHWVPEMVELAGGRDVLATIGERSKVIEWDAVRKAAPDVIVVMPCGYGLDKVITEMHLLTQRPGWNDLPAVKNKRVFMTDANAYFSRPGPRIAQGIEQLAQMLHPELFPVERPDWELMD